MCYTHTHTHIFQYTPLHTQVFTEDEKIEQINDTYWRLRAEVVPEEETMLDEGDVLMHAVHLNSKVQVCVLCVCLYDVCVCMMRGCACLCHDGTCGIPLSYHHPSSLIIVIP